MKFMAQKLGLVLLLAGIACGCQTIPSQTELRILERFAASREQYKSLTAEIAAQYAVAAEQSKRRLEFIKDEVMALIGQRTPEEAYQAAAAKPQIIKQLTEAEMKRRDLLRVMIPDGTWLVRNSTAPEIRAQMRQDIPRWQGELKEYEK